LELKKILSVIITTFLLSGCGAPSTKLNTPTGSIVSIVAPTLVPTPILKHTLLLKITRTGGLCPYGGCHQELILDTEGAYTLTDGDTLTQQGIIDKSKISQLAEVINHANFNQIKAQPYTGICPTAYDGSEVTYTFCTSKGIESISSCKIAIDEHQPLFQLTNTLWQEILSKR
jgi:hypothetical protein